MRIPERHLGRPALGDVAVDHVGRSIVDARVARHASSRRVVCAALVALDGAHAPSASRHVRCASYCKILQVPWPCWPVILRGGSIKMYYAAGGATATAGGCMTSSETSSDTR